MGEMFHTCCTSDYTPNSDGISCQRLHTCYKTQKEATQEAEVVLKLDYRNSAATAKHPVLKIKMIK